MKHSYLNNIPVEEAKKRWIDSLTATGFTYRTEVIPTKYANGRITAKAVYAAICSPHYNASAMDGIAVRASDTYGASEHEPKLLTKEQYTVADTGDPLPETADSVIMAEDVTEDENLNVKIIRANAPWQNVRQVGEDICQGDMIAPGHTLITPALCGAFLAGGITEVEVIQKPLFGIIPTGDEIVPPTNQPKPGEIIEFNSTIFASQLADWQCDTLVYGIVRDKKDLLEAAVKTALKECDAVLILAGSSAGRDDYTSIVVAKLGEVLVHGVAAKPGKPAILGVAEGKPVVGLPGYPVSAIVVMEEFVKPLVDFYYRKQETPAPMLSAVLAKKAVSSLKYKEYVRVSVGKIGENFYAVPLPRGAGIITSFTKASGILEIGQNREGYEAGEEVKIRLLKPKQVIENSLIITGSHDPVIDEIADILQTSTAGFSVISSHVGSMGAIQALKNKQAHMGAIHLLDPESGVYNETYVSRYFPNGEAVLRKGIGRVQGLMVKKGNPLNIRSIADIRSRIYVNRQRGAGTRVLFDFLLSQNGISPDEINGYRNEQFTHTAVAALIRTGNADVGMGIYATAKMYDLDFIPIKNEEYDFLILKEYADSPMVKAFFEALHSEAFQSRMDTMGGYRWE